MNDTKQREQRRHDDDDAELFHVLADDPGKKRHRQKHDDVDERDRDRGAADLGASAERSILRLFAHVAMPRDIFQDDDRIVDEDADRRAKVPSAR